MLMQPRFHARKITKNMPKTLILWRHAKAVEPSTDTPDHDRPLTQAGHAHAGHLAAHLAQHGVAVDLVLCSSSARTRQTLAALQPVPPTQLDPALYLASAGGLISQLQHCDNALGSIMVIGHNPGLHQLAMTLMDTADNAADAVALQQKLPTAGLAVFSLDIADWADIAPHTGRLTHYATPQSLGVK